MERIEPLADFYEAIAGDTRIGAYHISLYMALMQARSTAEWQNPIIVYREPLLQMARMSRKTYNNCMRDLTQFGYLKYQPSNNPQSGSRVYFNKI